TRLMVDSGSQPNLIKASALHHGVSIDKQHILRISGVTNGSATTLGSVSVNLLDYDIVFHEVPDTFPIETDGILGTSFMCLGGIIDYTQARIEWKGRTIPFSNVEVTTIPARTVSSISIRVTGPKYGYAPEVDLAPGVHTFDCLVRNRHGKAVMRCVNTNWSDVTLTMPSMELEEVLTLPTTSPNLKSNSKSTAPLTNMDSREDKSQNLNSKFTAPLTMLRHAGRGQSRACGYFTLRSDTTFLIPFVPRSTYRLRLPGISVPRNLLACVVDKVPWSLV
ncbi:hypothetical protein WH47_06139, partial [Habropoda laboriosa]